MSDKSGTKLDIDSMTSIDIILDRPSQCHTLPAEGNINWS